jgi:hypothetical protein
MVYYTNHGAYDEGNIVITTCTYASDAWSARNLVVVIDNMLLHQRVTLTGRTIMQGEYDECDPVADKIVTNIEYDVSDGGSTHGFNLYCGSKKNLMN